MTDYTTFTTPSPCTNDEGSSRSHSDVSIGDTMYHGNPIGNNHVFGGQKGEIIGFVNATKKRALIKWENGAVKKHNVSSLVRNPPTCSSTVVKASKKRKYNCEDDSRKKRLRLSPPVRGSSMTISDAALIKSVDMLPDATFDWLDFDELTDELNEQLTEQPPSMFDDMLDDIFDELTSESSTTTVDDSDVYGQLINELLGPIVHLPKKHCRRLNSCLVN